MQCCYTPFPIWNQSAVPCLFLTVASWPTYKFLRRQVRWSGIPISLRIFHSLLWSTKSKAFMLSMKHMFFWNSFAFSGASLVAQRLKRLPPMWETRVRSLGREDPMEKEMAIHSSILAWRIPWTEKPSRLQSTGLQRVGHYWATSPYLTTLPISF